ncbi:MAG: DMT family transporter [Pseudonocardia sp.]
MGSPGRTVSGTLAVAVAAALFGTSATVAQRYAPGLDAGSVAAWRLVVGGTVLVVAAWVASCAPWRFPARGLSTRPWTVLLGAGAVVAFQVGYFAAVERLGVGQATVLTIATSPIAAGLADHARGQAGLTGRWAAGVILAVAGIALLGGAGWTVDPAGWALAIAAGCCFPVYGAVLRALGRDRPGLAAVATVFGVAVLPAAAGLAFTGYASLPAAADLGALAYLGVVATAVAYLLWIYGLRTLSVRDTVLVTMLEPVTAVLLAAAVLGETLPAAGVAGIAAVVAGIAWAALPAGRSSAGTSSTAMTTPAQTQVPL